MKKFFWIGLGIVLVSIVPYILLSENSYIPVHDNLDSNVVWFKIIAESGHLFSSNQTLVEGMMGNLPRVSYPSELNFLTWLYYFFSPITAYLLNFGLVRIIAFISMFLLLREFSTETTNRSIYLITIFSVLFSLSPFWPSGGISTAGQPLVLYLFLVITRSKKIWPFILLLLYTFYSSLVLSGVFVGFCLFAWFIVHCLQKKKIDYYFLIGLFIFISGYIISDYRLFLSLISSDQFGIISHREEMVPEFHNKFFQEYLNLMLNGHYHSAKLPLIFGALILILTPIVIFCRKIFSKNQKIFLFITYTTILFAVVAKWEGIAFLYDEITFLKKFQFTRFFSLVPVLVFTTVYLIFKKFLYQNKIFLVVGIAIIALAFLDILRMDMNYRNLAKSSIGMAVPDPTFKEFYSKTLFDKIKEQVAEDDLKVLTFGIHPAVAQYNNVVTEGGYAANYPLSKKHQFLNLLGEEWAKENPENLKYIEHWGSRLYIFNDEFEKHVRYKWSNGREEEIKLNLNWDFAKSAGVQYIVSTNRIEDEELSLVGDFEDDNSVWVIYLYKLF